MSQSSEDQNITTLNELPPELLENIFSKLDSQKDICNVTEVCKKFKDIIEQSDRITNKLTLFIKFPLVANSTFMNEVGITKRKYKNVHISRKKDNSSSLGNRVMVSEVLKKINSNCKNLTLDWSNVRIREASLVDTAFRGARSQNDVFNGDEEDAFDAEVALNLNLRQHHEDHNPPDNMPIRHHRQHREGNHNEFMAQFHGRLTVARNQARDKLVGEFLHILNPFSGKLQQLKLKRVHLEKNIAAASLLNFSILQELIMEECDAFCFDILTNCTQLKKLELLDPQWGTIRNLGIDIFEDFLVKQTQLKDLHIKNIHYPRLFEVDKTNRISFKLKHLVLNNVFFQTKQIAEGFFETQNQLESVDLQIQNEKTRNLEETLWYNNILKSVVKSPKLKSIKLEKLNYNISEYAFLSNIINPMVKKLDYKVTAEDKNVELFKSFIHMFPNLSSIKFYAKEGEDTDSTVCFENPTILDKVQELSILNSSVRSLINVHAENLQVFEYSAGKTGEFIDDRIGGFLHRHGRTIKHLVIGSKRNRSYFFVSYNLCQLIVNFLSQLKSLTVFNFAEVNKSVKLLCTMRNLESLTLSASQYQEFTAKTKVECERMKLKLIPINIEESNSRE